ncbi:hypothetical protein ACIBCN_19130 [Nocardia sp. NPDC051052]|uniref:hypothetical protein n=1 Tax=Nocardia sp. NPDC051052 TaxID=3364322 RepID=UPI00379EC60E
MLERPISAERGGIGQTQGRDRAGRHAILIATWVATFVLYLFVKPDQPFTPGSEPSLNTVPAAVNPAVAPR